MKISIGNNERNFILKDKNKKCLHSRPTEYRDLSTQFNLLILNFKLKARLRTSAQGV